MSAQHPTWRRVGKGSGPANVLNGRYRVERAVPSKHWVITDITCGRRLPKPGTRRPWHFPTMAAARAAAEAHLGGDR